MKTILYQPLFINPQAYFVFPQLYHIEKGDSYIEPANITGQLIINDLTKVLTSTPTLNVVQDTNSYYSATNINIDKDNSIVYQTKNKYNEQTIYPGDKQDTDTLFIGTIRKDDSRSFIGCHGDILIFNRTLTEYELSWVKNNMMCSKQQEPDIDL